MLITKIKNEKGEIITSRKGIANVFGEFYKKRYDDNEQEETQQGIGENENDSSLDMQNNNTNEMQSTNSKKGKPPDSKGIRAEDIKACDDETREMVRRIFNEIIKRNEFTAEAWKKVKTKVIHKNVENVGNYRPICSLPALYRLFTTVLYGRVHP